MDPKMQKPGQRIGELQVGADGKSVQIRMGGNTLKGKIEKLKKPYLIARKTSRQVPFKNDASLKSEVLEVQAVVRQKALFTTRPSIKVPRLFGGTFLAVFRCF